MILKIWSSCFLCPEDIFHKSFGPPHLNVILGHTVSNDCSKCTTASPEETYTVRVNLHNCAHCLNVQLSDKQCIFYQSKMAQNRDQK